MELTSRWLVLVSCVATVCAVTLLVVAWRRMRGWWAIGRVVLVLLCEALALTSGALEVNRVGDFYPTWSSLLGGAQTRNLAHAPATNLSAWLRGRATEGRRAGLTFTWKTLGEGSWRLGEAPIVYLPADYFRRPEAAIPVIVALSPVGIDAAHGAWNDRTIQTLAAAAAVPSCVVFLRIGRGLDFPRLAANLPGRLAADIRVMPHGWALIGVGAAAASALRLLHVDSAQFNVLALILEPSAVGSALVGQARKAAADRFLLTTALPTKRPAPSGHKGPTNAPAPNGAELSTALRWAYTELPPSLAPPLVVTPLPTPTRPSP